MDICRINEYSFIMAKSVDQSKLERIREASVKVISRHGITGSPVSAIAAEAQVSVGYLYRYYPSKEVLIDDILSNALNVLTDRVNLLMENAGSIEGLVKGMVEYIIEGATREESKYKFMIMLLNDFSVKIHPETVARIKDIAGIVKERFDGSLEAGLTTDDLYLALVAIPLQYLAAGFRFGFDDSPRNREELIEKITSNSICVLKMKNNIMK